VRVLGINCFSHDTAACLLQDGRLVALAEEERFNRQRHTKRFPDQAIGFCLSLAGIGIDQVDVVAFAHRPGLDLARGVADALARRAPKRLAVQAYVDANLLRKEAAFRARWRYRGRITHVGHHDAHAASAFYPSPFERAAVLTPGPRGRLPVHHPPGRRRIAAGPAGRGPQPPLPGRGLLGAHLVPGL
jgi:carbamoyltransferase